MTLLRRAHNIQTRPPIPTTVATILQHAMYPIVIPTITVAEVADFPARSATPAEVLEWVKSRCTEFFLNSGQPLVEVKAFDGAALYTTTNASVMMRWLNLMGFGGSSGSRRRTAKAKEICGFIFGVRRFLVSVLVVQLGSVMRELICQF